jgi:2-dehydropantoate 2-reductase
VRLYESGHDVTLVARGENYKALNSYGATLESPSGISRVRIPVVDSASRLSIQASDLVILSTKGQDTGDVLSHLAAASDPSASIICAQNGVENERVALRHFENVYGMYVMCQAIHLTPGVVKIPSAPISAILDVGRWATGSDSLCRELTHALNEASFDSIAREDIARWKWGKLLRNLGNVVEAICGSDTRGGELIQRAVQEGTDVLVAAGIPFVSDEENLARRAGILNIAGPEFGGGSSWQSLVRQTGTVETDYLTGEIILQGRLHGVATPVNELLLHLANQLARERSGPGRWSEAEVMAKL